MNLRWLPRDDLEAGNRQKEYRKRRHGERVVDYHPQIMEDHSDENGVEIECFPEQHSQGVCKASRAKCYKRKFLFQTIMGDEDLS